jgi:hypothetical protein
MCEVRFREKTTKYKPKKKTTMISNKKEMDCDEPHLMSNEKT